jgi:hypothetical protein
VNAALGAGSAVVMAVVAMGIYNLQTWLERSDYRRHFQD